MYVQPQPQKKVKLSAIEIWWANLLPAPVKAMMPHWTISATIVTALALISGSHTKSDLQSM